MNRFVPIFRKFAGLKVSVVLSTPVLLVLLGIISGSQGFLSSPSAFAASNCQFYTVKSGDTLSEIGTSYHTTYQAIAQVNHIPNVNLIYPGQRFCIPVSGAVSTPKQGAQQAVTSSAPAPAPVAPSSSVTGMIEQIFGAYAPEAINIARCRIWSEPQCL